MTTSSISKTKEGLANVYNTVQHRYFLAYPPKTELHSWYDGVRSRQYEIGGQRKAAIFISIVQVILPILTGTQLTHIRVHIWSTVPRWTDIFYQMLRGNLICRSLISSFVYFQYGDTALHTSCRYGHAGVTRILISARCNINIQNKVSSWAFQHPPSHRC